MRFLADLKAEHVLTPESEVRLRQANVLGLEGRAPTGDEAEWWNECEREELLDHLG
jgi:hypothetical protein